MQENNTDKSHDNQSISDAASDDIFPDCSQVSERLFPECSQISEEMCPDCSHAAADTSLSEECRIEEGIKSGRIKPFEELRIMDDYMFGTVMSDTANLKPLIECILNINIVNIQFTEKQRAEKHGYISHGIRVDLYVEDDQGRVFDIEVQTTTKKHLPKRMRYYQSVIDITILRQGVDYQMLKRSYVVFICNYDPFGEGKYMYTFENRCIENPELALGDDSFKVIVNTKGISGEASERLKEVLLYMDQNIASGDYTKQIDAAVKQVLDNEERRKEYMFSAVREMEIRAEAREEGIEEGRKEERLELLIELVREKTLTLADAAKKANMSISDFMKATGLPAK